MKLPTLAVVVLGCILGWATSALAVYKCTDGKGRITYSDVPCPAGLDQTGTDIRNRPAPMGGAPTRSVEEENRAAAKIYSGINAEREGRAVPDKTCAFDYYVVGDEKGRQLALDASAECKRNRLLKEAGRASEMSYDAYNLWKDHRTLNKRSPAPTPQPALVQPNLAQPDLTRKKLELNCKPTYFGDIRCEER